MQKNKKKKKSTIAQDRNLVLKEIFEAPPEQLIQ
jgi:hypothetical protein